MNDEFGDHGSQNGRGAASTNRDEALSRADDLFSPAPPKPVEPQPVETPQIEKTSALVEPTDVTADQALEALSEVSTDDRSKTDAKPGKKQKEAASAEQVPPADPFRSDMGWFVVHVYSGFEMKAKRALEERIRTYNMQGQFGGILVPQETVVELVRGQKKTLNKKFYPGYMLVQMMMNEDTWHLVKETPKVTGFVGDVKDPAPLMEEEVRRLIGQIEQGAASPRARMSFEQGETVKVIDGPFSDFNGTVEEVKPEKGKVKVLISIFGRATPVELDFVQVEKIS